MPCESKYLEQTIKERYEQTTAYLACWVCDYLKLNKPSKNIHTQSKTYYAKDVGQTKFLCNVMKNLTPIQRQKLIACNSKQSRALFDWWEEHQEIDLKRAMAEKEKSKSDAILKSALAKLSPKERAIIKSNIGRI